MLGNRKRDQFVIDKNTPNDHPYSGMMVDPPMRKENLTLPAMGSTRLNGLYAVQNMPVIYTRSGQKISGNQPQGGTKNDVLAQVKYPKRMPYPTK